MADVENPNLGNILDNMLAYQEYLTEGQVELVKQMLQSPDICALSFVKYSNYDGIVGNNKEDNEDNPEKNNKAASDFTGFVAMGFLTPSGEPVMAIRGSEPLTGIGVNESDDWVDNFYAMMLGKRSDQYDQAEHFFEEMKDMGSGKPFLLGHSKAGNIVLYLASLYGHCNAEIFNPMPLHSNFANYDNLSTCAITTNVQENDFISLALGFFTPDEIEALIGNLSKEDFVAIMHLDADGIYDIYKRRKEIFADIDEISIKDIYHRWKHMSFEDRFEGLVRDNDTYVYPGEVHLQFYDTPDDKEGPFSAHGVDNFYDGKDHKTISFFPTIEVDFSHNDEIIRELRNINNALDNLDYDLNSLLRNIIVDYNPFNLIHNLVNGGTVLLSDLYIERSRTIDKAVNWLEFAESQFDSNETLLCDRVHQLPPNNSSSRSL